MDFRRLEEAELNGKTALVRVDFNVPRADDGRITDDTRLQAAIPTIKYLRDNGARTVLLSHYGRPKGEYNPEMSLNFIVPALSKALGGDVTFIERPSADMVAGLDSDAVVLVENTRFAKMETDGDPKMAQFLASLGDIFVMDAFSASHRNHASSAVVGEFLPSYAGLAMERELDHLAQALESPKKPVMAIVGGAKVSTKIDLLENLISQLDKLVIGGGMANTFLFAQGYDIGSSLCEKDLKETALRILAAAEKSGCEIILPIDVVAADDFKAHADHRVCGLGDVAPHEMILDAGPDSVTQILDAIDASETLVWNGPLGAFELAPFDTSTVECAKYAAKRCKNGEIIAVAGGGDTVSALNHAGAVKDFTFISTAGGAFLEWMEGKALPGVEILKK